MKQYKPNRPLWLAYSKKNLKRFPRKTERYKAFLREAYPKQEPFTIEQLAKEKQENNLAIPLTELVKYGEECNWLTNWGLRFKSAKTFCAAYNGVWIDKKRREAEQRLKKEYLNAIGD